MVLAMSNTPTKPGLSSKTSKAEAPDKKQFHRPFRHISDNDRARILEVIRTWQQPSITWDDLAKTLEDQLGHLWTRQTLYCHQSIREAFKARKSDGPTTPKIHGMEQVIERMREEVKALKAERAKYQELFVQLIWNAHNRHKVPLEELEKPLPYSARLREIPIKTPPNVEIPEEVKAKVVELQHKGKRK